MREDSVYTCTTPDISNSKWSPECDIDGSHKAVQCKSNGADPRYTQPNNKSFCTQIKWRQSRLFPLTKSIFTSHGGGGQQLLLLQQGRQTHLWIRLEHEGKARQNEMPYVFRFKIQLRGRLELYREQTRMAVSINTSRLIITLNYATECSRLVDNIKKNQEKDGYKNNDLTYHCSSNGNFEPLQCNRGMCYCANTQTGQPVSFVVNAPMWKTLPCCELLYRQNKKN